MCELFFSVVNGMEGYWEFVCTEVYVLTVVGIVTDMCMH